MTRTLCTLGMAISIGCGANEPNPRAPEPAAPKSEAKPALQMQSELGSVDPAAVTRVFRDLESRFSACQQDGLDRVEVLAGRVKFFIRIGGDGSAKWVYLEDSELGDRATEKCLIATAKEARWPKPDGGDAEASYSMDLPLQATRPPNDWSSDKVTPVLAKNARALDACKAGGASFRATLYVGPGGRVLAAGVATKGKGDDEKADCVASVLAKLRGLPSPGSWPAKVTFDL